MRDHAPDRVRRRRLLPLLAAAAWLVAAAVPGRAPAAPAPPDTVAAAWRDSLVLAPPAAGTAAELRGFCWLAPDTALALLAVPSVPPVPGDSLAPPPRFAPPDSLVRLVWLAPDGTALREADVTGLVRRGLAWDDTCVWSLTDATPEQPAALVRVSLDSLAVVASYPLRGHRPRDVAWDGRAVWVVDRDAARLVRYDPETGEPTRSLPTPGFTPTGVAAGAGRLWVCDAGTGRLVRLTAGGRRVTGIVRPSVFTARGRETGLAWGRGALWCWSPPDLVVRELVPSP